MEKECYEKNIKEKIKRKKKHANSYLGAYKGICTLNCKLLIKLSSFNYNQNQQQLHFLINNYQLDRLEHKDISSSMTVRLTRRLERPPVTKRFCTVDGTPADHTKK